MDEEKSTKTIGKVLIYAFFIIVIIVGVSFITISNTNWDYIEQALVLALVLLVSVIHTLIFSLIASFTLFFNRKKGKENLKRVKLALILNGGYTLIIALSVSQML